MDARLRRRCIRFCLRRPRFTRRSWKAVKLAIRDNVCVDKRLGRIHLGSKALLPRVRGIARPQSVRNLRRIFRWIRWLCVG